MGLKFRKFLQWFVSGISDTCAGFVAGMFWGHWLQVGVGFVGCAFLRVFEKWFCDVPDERDVAIANLKESVNVWHGCALQLETDLANMTKLRNVYKHEGDKLREELRIQRLVGGNRFGGAL